LNLNYGDVDNQKERRENLKRLVSRSLKVVIAIVAIKLLRYGIVYTGNNDPSVHSLIEVFKGPQGIMGLKMIAVAGIFISLSVVSIGVALYRWEVMNKRGYWILYFILLDLVLMYLYPEFAQSLLLALVKV